MKRSIVYILMSILLITGCTPNNNSLDNDTTANKYIQKIADSIRSDSLAKSEKNRYHENKIEWRLKSAGKNIRIEEIQFDNDNPIISPGESNVIFRFMPSVSLLVHAEIAGPVHQPCTLYIKIDDKPADSSYFAGNTGNTGKTTFHFNCKKQ